MSDMFQSKTSWFQVPNSRAHLLVDDEDKERFPLGRAHCAPFERRKTDALLHTNEVKSTDFCGICTVGFKTK
jgi:hypothetical protein